MNDIAHRNYLLTPTARENDLGQWLPVVWVRAARGRHIRLWKPRAITGERHSSRQKAELRSVEIAKQMIDRGEFHN